MKTPFGKLTLIAAGATCAMMFAQCSIIKSDNTDNGTKTSTSKTVKKVAPEILDSLVGEWSVTEIGRTVLSIDKLPTVTLTRTDGETTLPNADNVVLMFAFSGCNTINGAFEIKDGHKMTPAGEFLSTMMICPDVIDYDSRISEAVNNAKAYDIVENNDESTLYILDGSGKQLLRLRKHNIEFLNGAWKVIKLNGQPVPALSSMGMVIDLPEGKIHANGGCNVINGNIAPVMDVTGGIHVSNLSATRMSCPDLALEMEFTKALDEVAQARKGGALNTAVLLDNDGKVLMTLERMTFQELTPLSE